MILDRTMWSELFEKFIASKYPNEKRFGLEGCESLIPGMKALIDKSVDAGVKSIVMGMPHRGRLNVLGNVIRKPLEAILNEFAGNADKDDSGGGDVKYHLGANYVRPTPSGKKVSLSLVANPSHLEAEDPVVLGKTRAIQHFVSFIQSLVISILKTLCRRTMSPITTPPWESYCTEMRRLPVKVSFTRR